MLFSPRLPHVLPRKVLADLLAPTYAAGRGVDEDEARDRLERALAVPAALEAVYGGLSQALRDAQGARTSEDKLIDKLSQGVLARRYRVPVLAASPPVAAALVRLDLEVGLAPESMRETLASPRGRALLDEGLRVLGAHLVKELRKG